MSISLNIVADMMLGLGLAEIDLDGQRRSPIELYTESHEIFLQIVEEFGRSPESLRDVIVSLVKLASCYDPSNSEFCKMLFDANELVRETIKRGWQDRVFTDLAGIIDDLIQQRCSIADE